MVHLFYVEMPKNKTLIGVHFDRDYGRTGKPDGYSYFVSEYEDEITVRDNKNNRIVKISVKNKLSVILFFGILLLW